MYEDVVRSSTLLHVYRFSSESSLCDIWQCRSNSKSLGMSLRQQQKRNTIFRRRLFAKKCFFLFLFRFLLQNCVTHKLATKIRDKIIIYFCDVIGLLSKRKHWQNDNFVFFLQIKLNYKQTKKEKEEIGKPTVKKIY